MAIHFTGVNISPTAEIYRSLAMWQDKTKQMRTYPKEISSYGFSMIHRNELLILIQNENACERWYWIENENDSSPFPPNSACGLSARLGPQNCAHKNFYEYWIILDADSRYCFRENGS